ncbi:MAG TPA: protein-methionine-sulfoxide reductase heme-binding subunit MsrQ, partial [Accumulibacter sp.]|nr:protein-methionine-sulfoxide reductase heme-binding subunit MsrQ [Accumulibacter sp.]
MRLAALVLACLPAAWIAVQALTGDLGPRPVTAAIHQSGDWSVRLLAGTLLVTPLRRIAHWPRLIVVRRTMGLSVLFYAILHVALYCVDQKFDLQKILSEIVLRVYLTIGFVALCGLIALGTTSSDAMIRRLGSERWTRLHRLAYPIAGLSLLHFFIQSRLDVTQPVLMTGLFALLMGHRLMVRRRWPLGPLALCGLAVAGGLVTALAEFAWYGLATGANAWQVLKANLDFSYV